MKKGQVTLFILLGVVLLASVIISIAIFTDMINIRPPDEKVVGDIPIELAPLQRAIADCQERIADEAIRKALSQGGYLEPRESGIISVIPPAGTGMQAGGQTIAYWSHVDDGRHESEMPPLNGVEARALSTQVSDYIDARLSGCVDWDGFPGLEIERSEPTTVVTFSDSRVTINSLMPLEVTSSVGISSIPSWSTTLDAPVGHLYSVARSAVDQLWAQRVPARRTMDWLTLYADGTTELPPVNGGLRTTYEVTPYPIFEARPILADVLLLQAESMQLGGSATFDYVEITDEPLINDLYVSGIFSTPNEDVTNVNFEALYAENFNLYLAVDDSQGVALPETIPAPSLVTGLVPPTVDYSFAYDVTYPLLLSFEENGYTLNVGYEVVIDDNAPGYAQEIVGVTEDLSCTAPGGVEYAITTSPANVEAFATYQCGSITCPLGEVVDGRLSGTLPTCANGVLQVTADERFSEPFSVTSDESLPRFEQLISLHQPREVDVNVLAKTVSIGLAGPQLSVNTRPVEASVIMLRQGSPYVAFVDESGTAELVPGTYDVWIIRNEEFDPAIVIPEEPRCPELNAVAGFFVDEDESCYTMPEITFDSLPTVYAEYTGENGIVIDRVISQLNISAASINARGMLKIEDVELLGALFDGAAQLDGSADVRMR